jgi:AcrR family transcriptional regulator
VAGTDQSYHHGDLPAALLEAVDELVREQGPGAITLRAAARRAGVSHAAPAHHFGDKAGLLTAFATQGFTALHARLAAARDLAGEQPTLLAIGMAYVRFAVEDPGRFTVMFRPELLDTAQPSYRQSCDATFDVLYQAVIEVRSDLAPDDLDLLHAATGAWAIVHGLANLWLDGNLDERITDQPPEAVAEATLTAFVATVFVAAGPSRRPVRPPHT